jgi:putative transposase
VLPIAPSTYYEYASGQAEPVRQPARWYREQALAPVIDQVWQENHQAYGARKGWRQLHREGVKVAGCTVERLMRRLGLRGGIRGRMAKTTVSNKAKPCPLDKVNRQLRAARPNALWVSDFTYVPTWQGLVYVAFLIDVFARRIVGWKVSSSARTDFVLEALEQALHARRRTNGEGLIHHSDRGVQYVPIRYTERQAEAGIEPSVGSVGDSYDNALAETINGLYKAEVIHRQSWRNREAVEMATLDWVHWFNHHRLLGPIGNIPPAEAEAAYYRQQAALPKAA